MHRAPWWKTWGRVGLLSIVVLGETGCVAVLSTQVRQQADRTVSLEQLRTRPETYLHRLVILGGEIVRIWNVPGATFLEVLEKPLNPEDQPMLTDPSAGRFIVHCDRYLNPLTYTAGRVVTVAGRVLGTRTEKVGEIANDSPMLSCVEIYLWPPTDDVPETAPSFWHWWEWSPGYGDLSHW